MDSINLFSVSVKAFFSVAHSLNAEKFEKAKNLHGATYEVNITLFSEKLDEYNVVVDMVFLDQMVTETLDPLNFQNLDNLSIFKGKLTTTEFLAKHIFDSLRKKLIQKMEGGEINPNLHSMKIELKETSLYSGAYYGKIK